LIVDPDPEETTVLELRLIEQGFEVRIARTAAQAKNELEGAARSTAVVSEIDLEEPDAASPCARARSKRASPARAPGSSSPPRPTAQTAQRAFDLRVDDFILKPVSTDVLAAKLRQLIERKGTTTGRPRRLRLARRDVPPRHGADPLARPEDLRAAHHRAGQLRRDRLRRGPDRRRALGQLRGEDAFYKMLTLREGDFRLDPAFVPQGRTITASPEALLLEGMRRLDEASF
jgi:DNA-binding response OmpR family regulator